MLDTIPRSMWIKYWLVRNSNRIVTWAFWILSLTAAGAYWPIRTILIEQERMVIIHTSSLTVVYILFLCYIGYFFQWLTRKYMSNRSPYLRLAAMLGLMVLLLIFLDFGLGMEMRWS